MDFKQNWGLSMADTTKEAVSVDFARKVSFPKEKLDSIKKEMNQRMEEVDREYTNREREARIDASNIILNS